jgi:hypothetical protein
MVLKALAEAVAKRGPHRLLYLEVVLDLDGSLDGDGCGGGTAA